MRKDFLEIVKDTYDNQASPFPFESFDPSRATVWIDPLDGTSDFVRGNLPAVTVLIGLSIDGHSRLGIVHTPFSEEDAEKGRTIFGTIEHGAFRLFYDEKLSKEELEKREPEYVEPFDHLEQPKEDH